MNAELPRLERALLKRALHGAEAEEVIADMAEEYADRRRLAGAVSARLWLWRQVLRSAPATLGRSWFRGTTGFESEANRMRAGGLGLESWIMDARFALRGLRRRPQYVVLAVLTLALGIGGTTAVFGIARALLLNPLPYRGTDELVMFWNQFDWSEAELTYLRPDWPGFAKVAGYTTEDVFLRQQGAPPRLVPGISTSAELFDVLGAQPFMGRGFEPGADLIGAEPTAVLSYGLWQELGARRDIIGAQMPLDGQTRRIIGVMPKGFWFPDPSVRVWLSEELQPDNRSGRYAVVGRRAPGRSMETMGDALRQITTRLSQQFQYSAQWDKTKNAQLTPLRDHLLGPVKPALIATLAGMGVILLMACANVATLMLGQLRGRASELAVRMAIGAGRRRLTQQLVIEAAVLALLSGIVGAIAARAGFKMLLTALPLGELSHAVTTDWTLFLVALLIAFGAALLIALAPVFSLWRGDLRAALSHSRSGGMGARGGRLEDTLVIAEVALAVLLASGAAVLIRSVANLRAVDDGINERGVAVVDISASSEIPWQERWRHVQPMMSAVRALPGVQNVAVIQRVPLREGDNWGFQIEGRPDLGRHATTFRMITRDYFKVMGIPLKRGRGFEETDNLNSEPVIIIDEAFAAKYFPNQDPIGQRMTHGTRDSLARIVGVVGNVAHGSLTTGATPGRYVLIEQSEYVPDGASLVLRVAPSRDPAAVLQEARAAVAASSSVFAVQEATTMENLLHHAMGPTRRIMQLMTLLGALALTLGAVGVYGVVSHFVNRRRRDWVIKMALGMKPSAAIEQVVTRGAVLASTGSLIGLIAAFMLTKFLTALLYEVKAADAVALLSAAGALILTGSIAALIPALRASRANAAQVLRESA